MYPSRTHHRKTALFPPTLFELYVFQSAKGQLTPKPASMPISKMLICICAPYATA